MPDKNSAFKGLINDLSQYDTAGWRRRDISFVKREIEHGRSFDYPAARDKIVVIDTDGIRYELNVTKPDNEYSVCIGTPGRLKPWYEKKGYRKETLDLERNLYFVYTGHGYDFLILTETEYKNRI